MPRITGFEPITLRHELRPEDAYGMARALSTKRETTLIRLRTSDGIEGWGEAWGPSTVARAYLEMLRPLVEGSELMGFRHIVSHVMGAWYHLGIQNGLLAAISGLDIAIHDAIGRTLGVSVADLLGGKARDRVPVYASGGYVTPEPRKGFPAQLQRLVDARCGAAKIKIGLGPHSDVERCRLAREALGPDVLLLVDANGNYTTDTVIESMQRLEELDIHFYEEPLAPQDFDGYARLRQRAPIRIATGEALYMAHDFKRLLDVSGCDVVQPDLTLCGGLAEGRRIAELAQLYHVRLSPHVWGGAIGLAAACHFVASLQSYPHTANVPFPPLVEWDRGANPLREELLTDPIRFADGHLVVPDGPGLGVVPEPKAIERLRV